MVKNGYPYLIMHKFALKCLVQAKDVKKWTKINFTRAKCILYTLDIKEYTASIIHKSYYIQTTEI